MTRRTQSISASVIAALAVAGILGSDLTASQEPAPKMETLVREGVVDCAAYAAAQRVMVCEHAFDADRNEVIAAPTRDDVPVTGAVYTLEWSSPAGQGERLLLKFLPLDAANENLRVKATGTVIGGGGCCGVPPGGVHGESVLSIYMEARPGTGGIYAPHAVDLFKFRVEPVAHLGAGSIPGALVEDPASAAYTAGVVVELPFTLCATYVYEDLPLPSILEDPCYEAPPQD